MAVTNENPEQVPLNYGSLFFIYFDDVQAQRSAYFHLGNLVEVGATEQIFTNSSHQLTEDYITGRFG